MKLSFDPEKSSQYPNGYWYAVTDDNSYDGDGSTPLNAVTALAEVLEKEIVECVSK